MTKSELRKYYLEKRSLLTWNDINTMSKQITELVIESIPNYKDMFTHLFISIPGQKEINTAYLLEYGLKKEMKLATSITKFNPKRLEHSLINEQTVFDNGAYNTPLPNPIVSIDLDQLDIVLVPLLCIDKNGNRIGYGQGFYDSFLSQLKSTTKKIGLSLFEPLEENIEPDPWDIKLDAVIHPKGLEKF
ncbi:MAG: 5-formyltetrahydrofolate cyclo-ligase [Flavobacteriales bacterium]|nr:5-formyltetrahydrofolate cyclo-ligase [Flavobacteriales bacterium]MCB9197210.1 5-formyltetrahydrofolate cyclo-ligase [Flavobacteriales bacterium]